MTISESLGLLSNAENYTITDLGDGAYRVEHRFEDLAAHYIDGKWTYSVTGVYNSGINDVEIDVDALRSLVEFTRLLGSQE